GLPPPGPPAGGPVGGLGRGALSLRRALPGGRPVLDRARPRRHPVRPAGGGRKGRPVHRGRGEVVTGITRDEYRARLDRVRSAMSEVGLDALVAYANRTHPGHVRYLSGYETCLGIHDSAVCVVTAGRAALLTNASFDRPQTRTWLEEVVVTGDYAAEVA